MEGVSTLNPFQLSDANLQIIRSKVEEKRQLAEGRAQAVFSVLDQLQDPEELVAMEFLYAFMPLVDLADYPGELFLQHVRHSLETKRIVPWGEKVSGEMFLHFVLPYRISNETIEDYRPVFFGELYERVKDLSMADAISETNHWCHEKATYIAADPRTASPLTLVRTARGRCGEESALLVTALRSLGIPARQVYTPRWAHTDSNHAWVEAWADGEWFFLGACEPEPHLNMGWFDGPARRAMLIHTRVPGTIYRGPEEQVQVKDDYTELNLLPNYAPAQELQVRVTDETGEPVQGANVEFQVFNYGGFSPLVRVVTDQSGEVSLTTGKGDLLIHAFTDHTWGSLLAKGDGPRLVELVLGTEPPAFQEFTMEVPPELGGAGPEVTESQRAENNRRLKIEDEIRAAYESTFIDQSEAAQLAYELQVDPDKVWSVLEKARGNSHEMARFLQEAVPEYGPLALELLVALSAKDLTDTTSAILQDHLSGSLIYEGLYPESDFVNYVLQPRVSLEVLRPYRAFFQGEFTLDRQDVFRHNPLELKRWIERNIASVADGLVRGWPTPQGTYELKAGNILAKQILFVAMARSFGIPARLSPVDGQTQYLHEEDWVEVNFASPSEVTTEEGTLRFHRPQDYEGKIDYYQNFSLARLEGQTFQTLRFRGLDEEAFDEESFSHKLTVSPGVYRLTTGNRLPDGRVLVTLTTFTVEPGKTHDVKLIFAREEQTAQNLGQLPSGLVFPRFAGEGQIDLDGFLGEQGLVLAWLEPDREPTKHLIRDLTERKAQFEARGVPIVLCLGADKVTDSFDLGNYTELPATVSFIRDDHYEGLDKVQANLQEAMPENFPMVVVVNANGVVRYISTGYQIGTGTHILDSLEKG